MNLPYILLYFCGDDGNFKYMVIRDNAIFTDEKEAIEYRDKLNAEWEKDQYYRDRIKSLYNALKKEQEPYYIEESTGEITLLNKHDPIFHKSWRYDAVSAGIIALTEAEAERDRLNAEHRKEQE